MTGEANSRRADGHRRWWRWHPIFSLGIAGLLVGGIVGWLIGTDSVNAKHAAGVCGATTDLCFEDITYAFAGAFLGMVILGAAGLFLAIRPE